MAITENKKTHKLTHIELVEEDGQYYLSVEYLIEDDNRIEKLTIPRVVLPFNSKFMPDVTMGRDLAYFANNIPLYREEQYFIKTGFYEKLEIEKVNGVCFILQTIKEKEHEMTIEEIEKKLGYKVKIVSGGKKK